MNFGAETSYGFGGGGSGGGSSATARNGNSVDGQGFIVLGETVAQSGNPAKLLSGREIPFNGQSLSFIDLLNDSPVQSLVNVFSESQTLPIQIIQAGDGTTTQDGNGGYFMNFQPVNYGVTYPSNFAPGDTITMQRWNLGYVLANSNDNSGIVGMPDAVLNFGYNINFNNGRTSTADAAWRLGFETHFINDLQGPESNFEFHLPEVITFSGGLFRINSYYVDKTTAYTLNNRIVNSTVYQSPLDPVNTDYLQLIRTASGGGIFFFKADNSGQPIGKITFNPNTILQSFGTGDFFITNTLKGVETQFLFNGDTLFNQELSGGAPIQSQGVTVVGNAPNPFDRSAQLAVYSTTRGFLPPVMSTTQKNAISTPAIGLLVYDSVFNKLSLWTGATWETVTSI